MLTCADLFCGAGGLALGAAKAGFKHLLVLDSDAGACSILRSNIILRWPTGALDLSTVVNGTVEDHEYSTLAGQIDLLTAGPPCQPYSKAGKRAGHKDGRDGFPALFRAVRSLHPRAILVENVAALNTKPFRDYFDYVILRLRFPFEPAEGTWEEQSVRLQVLARLAAEGRNDERVSPARTYDAFEEHLNAADFGLAQIRNRAFVVLFRRDTGAAWSTPGPKRSRTTLLSALREQGEYWAQHLGAFPCVPPWISQTIARLPSSHADYAEALPRWLTLRDAIRDLPEPIDGVDASGVSNHRGIPRGAKAYGKRHSGSLLDWPAKTLKAGVHGTPGGENILVREDGTVRWLTIRECARLQGFPDWYVFDGQARSSVMRYIGNAVPVAVAEALTACIRESLGAVDGHLKVAAEPNASPSRDRTPESQRNDRAIVPEHSPRRRVVATTYRSSENLLENSAVSTPGGRGAGFQNII